MKKTGLLGYPIGHSLSPAIHNAAYRALYLDWQYALYPCPDLASFDAILSDVLADPTSFVGLNVTTPWKTAAYEAARAHSPFAGAAQNANVLTVVSHGTQPAHLSCDNTDGAGLIASLEREGVTIEGSRVVVCGSGPVATSALQAFTEKQAAAITIVSRDPQKAAKTVPLSQIRVVDYSEVAQHLVDADILINATTVGMNPSDAPIVSAELLRPTMVVVDVIYGHGETALIKAAREIGARAYDGLGMLIEQAALSIEIWAASQNLKLTAPRTLMLEAAQKELAKRS